MPSFFVTVVRRLEFGWRDVAAVFVEAAVVEPVDPFQRLKLDLEMTRFDLELTRKEREEYRSRAS